MRVEVSQAKRENEFYLQNVDKSKALQAMESRKRKKADDDDAEPEVRLMLSLVPDLLFAVFWLFFFLDW